MILSVDVEKGYTLTPDSQGRYIINPAILQALGNPSATITLVHDSLLYMDITVSDEASNVVTVFLQLRDANNEVLESLAMVECWLSDTAGGAPTSTPFSGAGISITDGTLIQSIVNNVHFKLLTASNGAAIFTLTETGDRTLYMNLIINNIHQPGDQALVWTA